ncbi:F0F1 ATP synthase subunit B [Ferroacidibacillus organovorans]|uniref:ATP synthase subunit b n=1 Tax=Ferroacidibacillus organovorans TaxID=1765683 RepID=A0A101XPL3_9BACL|nr:F0F1 ATP synthase subunit B [Ferroacidibacillus organovorans]KUO95264.1 ATP synthase F0 subunit B [Ferroacidibacillus organovorans]
MFELGTFVVSIVTFLILFLIIRKVGFEPLNNMLEKRRQYVMNELSEAERARKMSEAHLNEQKAILEDAKRQVKEMLDTARVRADDQAREILLQAQEEAQRLLESNRQLIERERAEAMNAVLASVASLTVQISEGLLRHHVTETEHQSMMDEAQQRLGELVC